MNKNKNIISKHDNDNNKQLKNYSQIKSFDRLSNEDFEITSTITAGGDESLISKDISD